MQTAIAGSNGRSFQQRRKATRLISVFLVATGINFAASYAYGLPNKPLPSADSAISFQSLRNADLRLLLSMEKACTLDPTQQVAHRLTTDETLQTALAAEINDTYRIGDEKAKEIVDTAIRVGDRLDVDPFIVLGIASVESSMNTKARSNYGATGLMQVYAPAHEKLLIELDVDVKTNEAAAKTLMNDLEVNVVAGARIYQQYLKQYKTVAKALQAYNGAKNDSTRKYSGKVLKKRDSYEGTVRMREQLQSAHVAISDAAFDMPLFSSTPRKADRLSTAAAFAPRATNSLS